MIPVWKRIALVLVLSAVTVLAEEVQDENVAKQTSDTDVEEGRGRRRFYKFLIKALAPMLSNVLSTVVLVKTKIVIVGLFLAGIYFFGHKLWPGGFCGHSIVSDGPSFFGEGITDYHGTGPDIISSYPGPEPLSYSPYYSNPPPGASISTSYLPPSISSSSVSSSGPSNAYLPPNRRGKRDTRVPDDEELLENEMYWTDQLTDMAFRFLGVISRTCRKRFVCEFDFHARSNPFILFATRAMGRDIFHNYRDDSDEHAKKYEDCGRIYAQCGVPKRSPNAHRRRRPLTTTSTTTTEDPAEVADDLANEIGSGLEPSAETKGEDNNTERSFDGANQQNDDEDEWKPVRANPLQRLFIPLLGSARRMN
nr:uncharacterized protein LOC109423271 [Aedes albopictus]